MAEHELGRSFALAGMPLHPVLVEMLDEHHRHRTERRGCGYTQATRYLADLTNRCGCGQQQEGAGIAPSAVRQALRDETSVWPDDPVPVFERIAAGLKLPESALVLNWIRDLLSPTACRSPALRVASERPRVGSCPLAEQYFLEIAHGRLRRGGSIKVWTDAHACPHLIEKQGLGDDGSAVSVRTLSVAGVNLPAGTLFALDYPPDLIDGPAPLRLLRGQRMALDALAGVRVLRLTTLALAPADRQRAFSAHFQQQVDNALYSPDTTTIQGLRMLADQLAGSAA